MALLYLNNLSSILKTFPVLKYFFHFFFCSKRVTTNTGNHYYIKTSAHMKDRETAIVFIQSTFSNF